MSRLRALSKHLYLGSRGRFSICGLESCWHMINVYVRELDDVWLGLAYTGEKIVATALNYDKEKTLKSLLRSLPPNADYQVVDKASDFAEKTIQASKEVHLGRKEFTDFTMATEYVSEPLVKVLKVAAFIPVGYVTSYGDIATAAGTEPKLVGQIMASNPLYPIVQCHRVVGSDFSLVGYGGRKTPQALNNKLARLTEECKGFNTEKQITVNGKELKIYPTEYVIQKAKKHSQSLPDERQRTLASYE